MFDKLFNEMTKKSKMTYNVGVCDGEFVFYDIESMCRLYVQGKPGSGKTTAIKNILMSFYLNNSPMDFNVYLFGDEVGMDLIRTLPNVYSISQMNSHESFKEYCELRKKEDGKLFNVFVSFNGTLSISSYLDHYGFFERGTRNLTIFEHSPLFDRNPEFQLNMDEHDWNFFQVDDVFKDILVPIYKHYGIMK